MIHRPLAPDCAEVPPAEPEIRLWWTWAAAALLARFLVMPSSGFPTDIGTFKAWAATLAQAGPSGFYGAGFADYLPGYLYVLWVIGGINAVLRFNEPAYLFALKLPSVLADVGTAWLMFAMLRRFRSPAALALSVSYLVNPGVLFNSAFWGQADAVAAFAALGAAAVAGTASPLFTAVLLTLAPLIKPQTAPASLLVGLYLLRSLGRPSVGAARWSLLLGAAAASGAALLIIILPFGLSPWGLIGRMRGAMDLYPYGSVVAFNLWGAVQGFWQSDGTRWLGVPLSVIGLAATVATVAAASAWAWRHPSPPDLVLASAVALLATFALPTRIHERYLLPAIPFVAVAAGFERRMLTVYIGLSAVFVLNLIYAFTRPYAGTFALPPLLSGTILSEPAARLYGVLVVFLLAWALWTLFRRTPQTTSEA